MKLLLCLKCFDVFKLDYELRTCKCKEVKGKYDPDGITAVTTDNEFTINLAMGNGSVIQAIEDMRELKADSDNKAPRSAYYQEGSGAINYAWVRPNNGEGNPHTKLLKEEK